MRFHMSMMSQDLAIQIIGGTHFSVPERIEMGLWPHPPIAYEWLLSALAAKLAASQTFPGETAAGSRASENLTIENLGDGFVGRAAVFSPLDPSVVQRLQERKFSKPRDAAAWYLKWQLGIAPERLPARLDGWTVE